MCLNFKVSLMEKLIFKCLTMVWLNFGGRLCIFLPLSLSASVNINRHCTHLHCQNTAYCIVDLVQFVISRTLTLLESMML